MKKKAKGIETVGDLIEALSKYSKSIPVKIEYQYDTGCETCGCWTEEGNVVLNDLETRLIVSHEEK